MPLPNSIRRPVVRCAIGAALLSGGAAAGQAPAGGSGEIAWSVPDAAPTEPVSIESTTPGAAAEEIGNPPRAYVPPVPMPAVSPDVGGQIPTYAPVKPSSTLIWEGAEARFEMLTGGDLGMDTVEGSATLKFAELDQFSISPQAGVLFLDGPTRTDLPARLYSGQVEFRWFERVAEPVFVELAFIPGLFTDGSTWGGDALRLQGRAVGYLATSEQTQFVLGATYLDREDVPVLPVVGLIHSPREDVRLEIMFPRPRVLKRIAQDSSGETWAYLSGELGGGAWAIERRFGRQDIANYRDYRLLAGLERKFAEGGSGVLEAGYVFGRELTYNSGRGDYDPEGTFLLRCGLSR